MDTGAKTSRLFSALSNILRHEPMRPLVRAFTELHVRLYRLTGGRAQVARYPTMLLTTTGRKSGKPRTIPLVYVADGERFVVAAAYSGSAKDPTWWLNLRHSGEALVEAPGIRARVRAELASPPDRERLWRQLVAMYPYFTEYQQRTSRVIPIVVLTPIAHPPDAPEDER